jgi:hypothetical protein
MYRHLVRIASLRATLLAVCLLSQASHRACAAMDKLQYELQERCAASARAAFDRDNPPPPPGAPPTDITVSYENHYNPILNKCFMLVIDQRWKVGGWEAESLIDVNDNKVIGSILRPTSDDSGKLLLPIGKIVPYTCALGQLRCRTESEWREMIRPYIGDTD